MALRPKFISCICLGFLVLLSFPSKSYCSDDPVRQSPPFLLGFYIGSLTERPFIRTFYHENRLLTENYIAAVDLTWVAYEFESKLANIEVDFTIAKRFGLDQQWDFGVIPMLRWKYAPWNDFIYTNFRIGLLGASYVTGISPWELHWSGNGRGSNYLNYLCVEVTASRSSDSPWEVFFRSHHRSGIFGTINGTYGGSTYLTLGFRAHL